MIHSNSKTLNGWRVLNGYATPATFQIYEKTEKKNERWDKGTEKPSSPKESYVK